MRIEEQHLNEKVQEYTVIKEGLESMMTPEEIKISRFEKHNYYKDNWRKLEAAEKRLEEITFLKDNRYGKLNEFRETCKFVLDINGNFYAGDEVKNKITLWNTSKVTSMEELFKDKQDFKDIPLKWNTSKVTNMSKMFSGCTNLNQNIKLNTLKVTDMSNMFNDCPNFNQPINFDTSRVTDMSNMFNGCTNFNQQFNDFFFQKKKRENFNTTNVTNMSEMFSGCTNFNQTITFNTGKVTDMSNMFNGCPNFNQPLNFNTGNVTDMSYMFNGCTSFNRSLNNWNIDKLENYSYIFNLCNSLEELKIKDFLLKLGLKLGDINLTKYPKLDDLS